MKLDAFYKLRTEFTVIGVTGRVGGGCSLVAEKLENSNFAAELPEPDTANLYPEAIKYKICSNYLKTSGNWTPFKVIVYKDVVLFHLLYYALKQTEGLSFSDAIIKVLTQNGNSKRPEFENRYDANDKKDLVFIEQTFTPFLDKSAKQLETIKKTFEQKAATTLNGFLTIQPAAGFEIFSSLRYRNFSKSFFDLLNKHDLIKRTRLIHDLSNNLRMTGKVLTEDEYDYRKDGLQHIYTNAETINRLIKGYRRKTKTGTHIVIDALKNSLELMYFKEKYSAFYMVATNQDEDVRKRQIESTIKRKLNLEEAPVEWVKSIMSLDEDEYLANDFKSGKFASPDIENCIQKSDYHIFIEDASIPALERYNGNIEEKISAYFSLDYQLAKLMALIRQPGIVTPSTNEHFMQVAYNAKFNSGCISRQVGAVVTDENYSIKAIGWNDVPEGQTPCSMRNIDDLLSEKPSLMFSEFERDGGYKDKGKFRQLVSQAIPSNHAQDLKGRNCSFCFKSFHNAFENDKNQVHTRSLHAEENAMMQITKFGGQGIMYGNLYTTASPCELCSKKAFQLGIRNIYYIDPYPGIAMTQILKAASQKGTANPNLVMFQGALGRAFHKLYEPFMAYKDELAILTGISPKPTIADKLKKIISDDALLKSINSKLEMGSEKDREKKLEEIIKKGLAQIDNN